MKTVTISARSKEINELLRLAKETSLLLQTTDGSQFVLTRMTDLQAFYVGDSEDLQTEVDVARANQALMQFLDERGSVVQVGKGIALAEVRRQLGL